MIERLQPTRVYRFYRGGAQLRGGNATDGEFPEDWIGSVTPANNPGRDDPTEGLTRLADGRLLKEVIEADPDRWLGREHVEQFGVTTGLLVKLLDPSQRLPVHAHPGREFARRHLGSQFGKTEAWIVLATREPEAEVWVGLRERVDPERYRAWIDGQDTRALRESLHRVTVRPGDVVYVPAGVPHAIGPGALIGELQEPTDFSIVCEWSGFPIEPSDSHLGLGWDTVLEALDLGPNEPVLQLPPEAAAFFWADERVEPPGRFAVLLVLEGEGELGGQPAGRGDVFAVPAALDRLEASDDLRVLRCLAPDPAV